MRTMVRPEKSSIVLKFLYHHMVGRFVLRFLSSRTVSRIAGAFLDSPLSRGLIKPFLRKNRISLKNCETKEFRCFNDCFCRKLREDQRPIDQAAESLIAPCDGLLSAYQIKRDLIIPVKQSRFSLKALLAGDEIYREYEDGVCLVFRLCVNHYHRYCYVDNGTKGENHFIEGKLHTVRPIALEAFPVFTENCREYTVIDTENFGRVVQMEVGAMLVGRILNYHGKQKVHRGQEKGRFLYGGSTIIVLLKKNAVKLPRRLFQATAAGFEIPVRMGEKIGEGEDKTMDSLREEVFAYVKEKYKSEVEYLWKRFPNYAVFRHDDNRKWYGIVMDVSKTKLGLTGNESVDVLNVKLDDLMFRDLLLQREGYLPGYHISRGNWISILLDGTVSLHEVCNMIDISFKATASKKKKNKIRLAKEWLIPANPKYYDVEQAFKEADIIDWKQSSSVKAGDTVYMYVAAPVSAILYKCKVVETDIPYDYQDKNLSISTIMKIKLLKEYPADQFTFDVLKSEYGIYAVRGPRGVPNSLSAALKR